MDALFEQRIADFHERPLPELTHREAELPALSGKTDAVIGMRGAFPQYREVSFSVFFRDH